MPNDYANPENTSIVPAGEEGIPAGEEGTIWELIRREGEPAQSAGNVFSRDPKEEYTRQIIRRHKAWLDSIPHECPSPYTHFRIGVYIRFFNQTKYENYLDYHKQQFEDTIALCPNWKLVDFYVDEGPNAPNMENAKGWTRLLEDCFAGRVNLIVTQKISNVSRKPQELAFCSRILASLRNPVGIYFISEDLYTLASYYQEDLYDESFLPQGEWRLLPDAACDRGWGDEGEKKDDQ